MYLARFLYKHYIFHIRSLGRPGFSWRAVAKTVAPIATSDIMDSIFTTAGIKWAKSGLFVVVFAFITVWVAL